MRKLIIFISFLMFALTVNSQAFTISGFVSEKSSGENMIGATVYIQELMKGTSTNSYGYYSISLEKGEFTIVASYLGFQDYSKKINI